MAQSDSNDDDDDDNDNATIEMFRDDPPWYTLIVHGTNEDDSFDSLVTVLEATGKLHKNRGFGVGDARLDAEEVAQTFMNFPADKLENSALRLWLVNRNEESPNTEVATAIEDASANGITVVIIDSIATLGTTICQIKNRVDRILKADMKLFIVDTETLITPADHETIIEVLESMDRDGLKLHRKKVHRDLVAEVDSDGNKHNGRPGLGFVMDDGERVKGPDFQKVRIVLKRVTLPDPHPKSMSKQQAAEELDCSRRTIYRALERQHLYSPFD